jgi:hypothetical protein
MVLKISISKLKLLFKKFGSPKPILYVLDFADVSKEKDKLDLYLKDFFGLLTYFLQSHVD